MLNHKIKEKRDATRDGGGVWVKRNLAENCRVG